MLSAADRLAVNIPLVERLSACYTGVLHDVMRAAGLANFVLPPHLLPVVDGMNLAGPAFTVRGGSAPCADEDTLLAWTGMLSKAPADHVLVIAPNAGNQVCAYMGELSAETLHYKKLRGALMDGGCRDTDFIVKLGFPVWASYCTPLDIVGRWRPEALDVAINIGGVDIQPGDMLCGDRDGVVVIPAARAEEIVTLAEAAIAKENLVRKAILQGVDPQQAYLRYGKF